MASPQLFSSRAIAPVENVLSRIAENPQALATIYNEFSSFINEPYLSFSRDSLNGLRGKLADNVSIFLCPKIFQQISYGYGIGQTVAGRDLPTDFFVKIMKGLDQLEFEGWIFAEWARSLGF